MAELTMHPYPEPVKLSRKAWKGIAIEASLDVDWEDLHDDDPERLIDTYDRVGEQISYIRALITGELTEAWVVLRTQTRLREEIDKVAGRIGSELLFLDRFNEGNLPPDRRRETDKIVKKLRKQARRLRAAHRDCGRWWQEYRDYKSDREAAERLGLSDGGGQD